MYHKGDFTSDAVMLSLSKHLKAYLNKSFDRLPLTDSKERSSLLGGTRACPDFFREAIFHASDPCHKDCFPEVGTSRRLKKPSCNDDNLRGFNLLNSPDFVNMTRFTSIGMIKKICSVFNLKVLNLYWTSFFHIFILVFYS